MDKISKISSFLDASSMASMTMNVFSWLLLSDIRTSKRAKRSGIWSVAKYRLYRRWTATGTYLLFFESWQMRERKQTALSAGVPLLKLKKKYARLCVGSLVFMYSMTLALVDR